MTTLRLLIRHSMQVSALTLLSLVSTSCGELARTGRSPAFLIVDSVEAATGAAPDAFGNVLYSDVETMVEDQVDGRTVRTPTVYADSGRATLRLGLKNPGSQSSPLAPSPLNEITITRYRVTFRRTDGRNVPGDDVPHAFDGAVTLTIPATGPVSAVFTLVRHQAKLEPPLRSLRGGGAANMVSIIAEIAFYGRDQAGHEINVNAMISINFGDFADPR